MLTVAILSGSVAAAAGGLADVFRLPAGHKVVGVATEEGFQLSTVPLEPPTLGAGFVYGWARDCFNDVLDSRQPLTPNLLAPVAPAIASAGGCLDGVMGVAGPAHYLEFYWSGDSGGSIEIWNTDPVAGGQFLLHCAATEYAGVGAGAHDTWVVLDEYRESVCTRVERGPPPSQWAGHGGAVGNWNRDRGSAYGFTLTAFVGGG